MAESEIASFRRQQALQEEAAQQGLSGIATVARHNFIEKKMETGANDLIQLIKEGKIEQANELVEAMQLEIREREGITETLNCRKEK